MSSGPGKGRVYAVISFHVKFDRLAVFCDAAKELLSATRKDKGCLRVDLHRELPWAKSHSNEEFSLFVMSQEWATPADVEAHVASPHASRFNNKIMQGGSNQVLMTSPSMSLFGEPLSATDLAALGAEAAAQAVVAEAQSSEELAAADGAKRSTSSREAAANQLNSSMTSTQSAASLGGARSSTLRSSGASVLKS
eukprot:gnl/TRDRNA2_/TRDRNA2_202050_c0_seq1.p1 gnl/TRDRNA2_/TRDRNA2_202050_c0~~gnl/TRDRNA2_/TRDRNA2_202050_c0_seq1.p1  ORF type:complete len:195 (+),score=38.58 gnl/TRDRNA2_/TRDRNA2_202050_c0_seq1:72-656(+)